MIVVSAAPPAPVDPILTQRAGLTLIGVIAGILKYTGARKPPPGKKCPTKSR